MKMLQLLKSYCAAKVQPTPYPLPSSLSLSLSLSDSHTSPLVAYARCYQTEMGKRSVVDHYSGVFSVSEYDLVISSRFQ